MSALPSHLRRLAEVAAGLIVAAALGAAPSSRAQSPAPTPNEVFDLHLAKSAAGVELTWQPPRNGADSYQVRRCSIPTLRVTYYGNCVAQGIVPTTWEDVAPAGNVFYLVTGLVGTTEGALGRKFDGNIWTPRSAPPCSSPEVPEPLTLTISLDPATFVCGTNILVRYPDEAMSFVTASCLGVTNGFLPATNDLVPGEIRHACASATGRSGQGDITAIEFMRGDCPLTLDAFDLVSCAVTVGQPDCTVPVTLELPCTLR